MPPPAPIKPQMKPMRMPQTMDWMARFFALTPCTVSYTHLDVYKRQAYLKANNITKLPSPNKLEAEYCALASEKAQFYEQYKDCLLYTSRCV